MVKIYCIFVLLSLYALVQGIAIDANKAQDSQVSKVDPNKGFVLQSGYEGYLVSQQKQKESSESASNSLSWLLHPSKLHVLKSLALPASSFLLAKGLKVFGVVLHLLLALLLGVVATTAVCTFTPICSISLANPSLLSFIKGQSVKEQVAELARTYMTPENIEIASRFVQTAIDKYSRRNAEQPSEPNIEENETY